MNIKTFISNKIEDTKNLTDDEKYVLGLKTVVGICVVGWLLKK